MHSKSVALAVGLATTASHAFLVPPEITSAQLLDTLNIPASASQQTLKLLCPACPISVHTPHGFAHMPSATFDSTLQLNFSVEAAPSGLDGFAVSDRLLVNGRELFPSAETRLSLRALHVPVGRLSESRGLDFIETDLGWKLSVSPPMTADAGTSADDDTVFELIQVDLQVFQVGGYLVRGIENVRILLVRLSNFGANDDSRPATMTSRLLMGDIITTKPTPTLADLVLGDAPPAADRNECTTVLCRWKAHVADTLSPATPKKHHCGGARMKMPVSAAPVDAPAAPENDALLPIQLEIPEESELHRVEHTWMQLAKRIWDTILLPAFFGISVGVVFGIIASWYVLTTPRAPVKLLTRYAHSVGVVVSGIFIHLWRTCVRGKRSRRCRSNTRSHHHRHKSSAAKHERALIDDEKVALMDAEAAEAQATGEDESPK